MPKRARRSRPEPCSRSARSESDDAAIIHQFAAEGRASTERPDQRPAARSSRFRPVTDHASSICSTMSPGLPTMRPLFPAGGLWTGYRRVLTGIIPTPATKSSAGSPSMSAASRSAQLLRERIFVPLGMSRTRGAIVGADRRFMPKAMKRRPDWPPYVRGVPLGPAAWVDVTRRGLRRFDRRGHDELAAIDCQRGPRPGRARAFGRAGAAVRSPRGPERHAGDDLRQRPDARRQCGAEPIFTTPAACSASPRPSMSMSRAASAPSQAPPSAHSPSIARVC